MPHREVYMKNISSTTTKKLKIKQYENKKIEYYPFKDLKELWINRGEVLRD